MVGTVSKKTRPDQALSAMLGQARAQRRVSLADASHALNIPIKQLEALEAGDFSIFSAEIYARGACLKYADYLGLQSEQSRRAIWRGISASRERVPLKIHTAFTWFERLMSARLVLWVAISAVVLSVGGYIFWQVKSFWQLPVVTLQENIPAMTTNSKLVIHGLSDRPETRITVNNERVILKPDATFVSDLSLHQGINVIQIEAQNAAGRKAVLVRHVLVPRS